jgi:hypothetical protein
VCEPAFSTVDFRDLSRDEVFPLNSWCLPWDVLEVKTAHQISKA